MKNRPALGQWVTARDRMYRRWDYHTKTYIRWSEFIPGGPKPVEGIYVGTRTIQDGHTEYCGPEEGNYWVPSGYKEAWLIVEDPRKNPIRVFPEDVTCHD